MAAAKVRHGTLVAATVATVTLTGDFERVEILNRDGVEEIYFTVDGTAPTVAGDDCFVLPKAIGSVVAVSFQGADAGTVVKLISAGTPKFSVTGQP